MGFSKEFRTELGWEDPKTETEYRRKLNRKTASDPLVDRDCVLFDGKCDCAWPKDDCKYVSMKEELLPPKKGFQLSKEEAKAIMSIGPDRDEYVSTPNPCIKGMTVETCPHNPRLGCDCGANPPTQHMGYVKVKKVLKSFSELKDSF